MQNLYLSRANVVLAGYLSIHNIERLEHYLANKASSLLLVGITTPYSYGIKPRAILYRKGLIVKELATLPRVHISPALYRFVFPLVHIIHLLSITFLIIRLKKKFDIFIGVTYPCALAGVFLKRVGLVRKLIYYSYDYFHLSPTYSFYRNLKSRLFQFIDGICVNASDVTWNLSSKMIKARERKTIEKYPEIVVPHGLFPSIARSSSEIERYSIAFIGRLEEGQGVELIIEALADIVKSFPMARLKVIGSGPHERALKELVKKKGLQKHIQFYGFVSDEDRVVKILSSCIAGVALYAPNSIARYTDPLKVKKYLECGLPVVVTQEPDISLIIEKSKAGFAAGHGKAELIDVITKLFMNENLWHQLRNDVKILAERYSLHNVYDEAFSLSEKYLCKAPGSKAVEKNSLC